VIGRWWLRHPGGSQIWRLSQSPVLCGPIETWDMSVLR
jgi:hypothetical protein